MSWPLWGEARGWQQQQVQPGSQAQGSMPRRTEPGVTHEYRSLQPSSSLFFGDERLNVQCNAAETVTSPYDCRTCTLSWTFGVFFDSWCLKHDGILEEHVVCDWRVVLFFSNAKCASWECWCLYGQERCDFRERASLDFLKKPCNRR